MVDERRLDLVNLLEMIQRGFGMGCCLVGMALLALIYCLFEMFDRFFAVRIRLRLLTGFGVLERSLGMSH